MPVLKTRLPMLNSGEFVALLTGFKDVREPITQAITESVVRGMQQEGPAKHRMMVGGASSYGADDVVISELFFAPPHGFLVWHLLRNRSSQLGGLLGLGAKEQLVLEIIASGKTLDDADKLLVEASEFITSRRADLFPSDVTRSSFVDAETTAFLKAVNGLRDFTSFAPVSFPAEHLTLSRQMTVQSHREFLIRLMQLKSLEEGQLAQEISGLPNGADLVGSLVASGFVERQGLITCQKNGAKLACVDADADHATFDTLWCPHCGRQYSEENRTLVFTGTPSLKGLMNSSRWLSVLVAGRLKELGLPDQHMVWDVKFGHEEIDLLAWVNGSLWAFELKTDAFDYSDARHFNYRRSLIKPQVAVVIAATGLAPDARKELDENSESGAITLLDTARNFPTQ